MIEYVYLFYPTWKRVPIATPSGNHDSSNFACLTDECTGKTSYSRIELNFSCHVYVGTRKWVSIAEKNFNFQRFCFATIISRIASRYTRELILSVYEMYLRNRKNSHLIRVIIRYSRWLPSTKNSLKYLSASYLVEPVIMIHVPIFLPTNFTKVDCIRDYRRAMVFFPTRIAKFYHSVYITTEWCSLSLFWFFKTQGTTLS